MLENGDVKSEPRIRVYVADDQPIYLEALARAIGERVELELSGQSRDGRQALTDLKELKPDVALLDISMSGFDGMRILAAAKQDALPTRIILLTGHGESELIYEAIAKGASGYLSKLEDSDQIIDAVLAANRGEIVLSPAFQADLVVQLQARGTAMRPVLTQQENEILRLTANGLQPPEIARQLDLTRATVKSALQTLYEKLGVSNRAAAVAVAIRKGLLD